MNRRSHKPASRASRCLPVLILLTLVLSTAQAQEPFGTQLFLPFVARPPARPFLSFTIIPWRNSFAPPSYGIWRTDPFGGEGDWISQEADFSSAWAPDGKQLVVVNVKGTFQEPVADPYTMVRMNEHGGEREVILPCPEGCSSPAWSPDGSVIMFASGGDLYTIAPDGTDLRRITDTAVRESGPAWSPDGTQIAFVVRDADSLAADIRIADAAGKTIRTFPAPSFEIDGPSWSPDGQRLAFGASFNLYTVNVDGSGLEEYTELECGYIVGGAAWSPDGTQIAYGCNSVLGYSIFIMDVASRELVARYSGAEPAWIPQPAP